MKSALAFVPKNLLSFCVGALSRIPLPRFCLLPLLRVFSSHYGVRLEDVAQPLSSFSTFAEFFTRELKPGSRPLGPEVVSPVDGSLEMHGAISNGEVLQVKGQPYSLSALLRDDRLAARYDGGYFVTLYLAPGDYHHVHAPIAGEVTQSTHVEGALWPVNAWSVRHVDKLFTVNERVVALLDSAQGSVAVILVGATNVGSISVEFDTELRTNRHFLRTPRVFQKSYQAPIHFPKGGRLGTFHLGSTVILLFEPGRFTPQLPAVGTKLQYGQTLGSSDERVSTYTSGGQSG